MANSVTTPKKLVAIGASAGGLDPLQVIISNLPARLGSASIIVAQHLSPAYKSMMRDLLGRKTTLPVEEIRHNQWIKANHIYTIPPDNDVIIENNKFKLVRPSSTGPKPNINRLFTSVAENYNSNAVGMILSGTGSDGASGIQKIKDQGGITLVQDPSTAKYDGMPMSALATSKVDHQLTPEEIGHYFKKLIGRRRNFKDNSSEISEKEEQIEETVGRVLSLLEEKVGTNFNNYKASTIYRRLEKRLNDKNFSNIDSYLSYVQNNKEELNSLFQYLLIGVTSFFRDPESFQVLEKYIEERLDENKNKNKLRIWVPGCASGEEAYTIAIIVSELINKKSLNSYHVQIFGTDIDSSALNKARIGIYDAASIENVPKNLRKDYFKRRGNKYEVVKHIRQMVLFTAHDLTSNPPFLKIDLISCRNLLIYFNQSLQNHILPIFHYALNSEGILFLGKSESVNASESLFTPINNKHKIFKANPTERLRLNIPQLKPLVPKKSTPVRNQESQEGMSLQDMVKETLYKSYDHPFIVIDNNLEMVEVFGEVTPFLKVRPGSANMNLLKLLDQDLQLELRAVATKAINNSTTATGDIRKVNIDEKDYYLRFKVKPVLYSRPTNSYFMVVFEQVDLGDKLLQMKKVVEEDPGNNKLVEVEHELASTKEYMNTLIEELETSNEELQALNEELQSNNEELQASNEELETSNEELQASNEELEIAYTEIKTAHEEIASQAQELKQSENRLKTLFNSTLQGFILINSTYNIETYNKTASKFFKQYFKNELKEKKSYLDLIPENQAEKFLGDIKKVVKGKAVDHEQKVEFKNDFKYLQMTYTPVITSESSSKQVLISFIDITNLKKAELKLKSAHEKSKDQQEIWHQLADLSPDLIAILRGDDFTYEYVNQAYQRFFPDLSFSGKKFKEVFPDLKEHEILKNISLVRKTGKPHTLYEIPVKSNSESKNLYYFNFTYAPLQKKSQKYDIIIYATDITKQVEVRKQIEEAHTQTAVEKNKLENLISSAPACIAIHRGKIHEYEFANKLYCDLIGFDNVIGKKYKDLEIEESSGFHKGILDQVFSSGKSFTGNEVPIEKEGEVQYYNFIYQPWINTVGSVEGVLIFAYDVTEQVETRHTIEANAAFINILNDSMPQKVWTAKPNGEYDYLNKPMLQYLGLRKDKFLSYEDVSWYKFIHVNDRKITSDTWKKALQTGSDYTLEHRLKDKEGNFKWHLTRGLPLRNKQGEIIKWVGTSTDIDEQKQVEHQKDEFLSVASHELKTPLTTVQAYSDLLQEYFNETKDEQAKVYISKTIQNLKKLTILINDLLDISRLQSGKLTFDKDELNFDKVVQEAIENIKHTTKSHNITLQGKTYKKVRGDQQRLEQVILNLLSNAIKYSPQENEVFVNLYANDTYVTCEVIDKGIGISEKHLKNIFNRYYRANEKHNFISGLGIGLFITKEIVEMHGGKVGVESTDGKGSKFYFSLPSED